MKILELVVAGYKNREIAPVLGTTTYVVKNYLREIYEKSGMDNRTELALWALHKGLVK